MIVIAGKKNMRRYKIRIDGAAADGKQTSHTITVLADTLEEVEAAVIRGLTSPLHP